MLVTGILVYLATGAVLWAFLFISEHVPPASETLWIIVLWPLFVVDIARGDLG